MPVGPMRRCLEAVVADEAPHPPGTAIAGFTLVEAIAASPIATVYRAVQGTREAAIKVYPPGSRIGARVLRERTLLQRSAHPCLVELLSAGDLPDGGAYVATAWIPGTTLDRRLAAGAMDWIELRPILIDLCTGLAALHDVGIVHRDIKPSNVMLPDDGRCAVLIDLGHALALGDARITDRHLTVGSATYMAPEQVLGLALDGRSDLYALGVVAYLALTGTLPFAGSDPDAILRSHVHAPVIPPRRRVPDRTIPNDAQDLCMWLLSKSPAARPPSAAVVVTILRSLPNFAKESP